ncbi:hypothetical protein ASC95_07555 [Pelomonas sp. Root1217]|nr:hypothetical protein ASC95_07555 [Pelomonas sp. Root1217]
MEPQTTPAEVGLWGLAANEVKIVVEYTAEMGCFVYMSHANSKDMGRNLARIVNGLIAQGVVVSSPSADAVQPGDPVTARFDVRAPQGTYSLMTMYDASRASWRKAAYVIQPFK